MMHPSAVHQTLAAVSSMLSILSLVPAGVNAQFDPTGGFTSTCPYTGANAFPDRIRALNSACCIPSGDGSECAGTCNAECIAVLFPILDECQDVINTIYDGNDGVRDGEASAFTSIYEDCMQIEPEDLIDMLKTLQDQGKCPPTILDSIGQTEVQDAACADIWTGGRCEMSIASGVFSCESDFCNTVPSRDAPCVVAGQCDSSCHFCGEGNGGGHRRLELLLQIMLKISRARRLQLGNVQCDPAKFATEAAAVDAACCDADGSSCADGVPTTCDAKCAVAFNSFYTRCQRFMAAQFSLDMMSNYDRLYATCTTSLPNEPLLRALVVCSSRAPDPCWGMDCGEHGTCSGGSCRCERGYSGRRCETLDPCSGNTCGTNGRCEPCSRGENVYDHDGIRATCEELPPSQQMKCVCNSCDHVECGSCQEGCHPNQNPPGCNGAAGTAKAPGNSANWCGGYLNQGTFPHTCL
eukprot:SAG31_NODE_1776_length_7300_cov_10.281905_7_plen_466_part_00